MTLVEIQERKSQLLPYSCDTIISAMRNHVHSADFAIEPEDWNDVMYVNLLLKSFEKAPMECYKFGFPSPKGDMLFNIVRNWVDRKYVKGSNDDSS